MCANAATRGRGYPACLTIVYTRCVFFYHFTSRLHLPAIVACGFLKTTDSILSPDPARGGPPCVWLLDIDTLNGHDHGLGGSIVNKSEVRFTVEVDQTRAVKWLDWAANNSIDADWRDIMVSAGGGYAAAEHWYCVFRSIPSDQWVRVEQRTAHDTWEQV